MIIVPIDPTNTLFLNMPPKEPAAITVKLSKPLERILLGALLLVVGYLAYWLVSYIWNDITTRISNTTAEVARMQATLDKALTSFDAVKTSIQDQRVSIAVIETRLANLEKPHYESKAKVLGFKNAEIVRTGLSVNTHFETKALGQKADYFIKYTILAYDQKTNIMKLRFDAKVQKAIFDNNILVIKIQPGEATELTKYFIRNAPSKIYLQVLDVPAPDQVILAIGHKQGESGEPS